MAEPHLPSLVIEGFRGFKKLELRKLGHVNLLVGKNGVGKSSVLDAVRLYATQFEFEEARKILVSRGEEWNASARNSFLPMFSGRHGLDPDAPTIRLADLLFRFVLMAIKRASDGELSYRVKDPLNATAAYPGIVVEKSGEMIRQYAFGGFPGGPQYQDMPARRAGEKHCAIPPEGISDTEIGSLWDGLVLGGHEDDLTEVFKLVRPDAKKLYLISGERRPYVLLEAFRQPVPLRSLGDGAARFLGIAASVVTAAGGFLLIDEFENGLHHSVQEELWSFVFRVAREMNVQVFATTHSEDCVRAFAIAANKDTASLGVMTKLVEQNGQIVAKQLMEEDVLAGAQGLVEMR